MARNHGLALATLALGGSILSGCFNPETASSNDDGTSESGSEASSLESTLESTNPTASTTASTTADTGDPTTASTTDTPTCTVDEDCPAPAECERVQCDDGECVHSPAGEGAPCGDDTDDMCTAPDSCDGEGNCDPHDAPDGAACTDCEVGQCSCNAGVCGACTYAPANDFITTRAIEGWELTGGWALYRETPQSRQRGPVLFSSQVLGTDGNRSQPYPGGEFEESHARSAPTVLPATIELSSWHVDEGGGTYDNKSIALSIDDGASWTVIADCVIDPALPFCMPRNERAADDWDPLAISVPADMVGELGLVELRYVTGDDCCDFEQGWYVDVANFGIECGCGDDSVCEGLGGECGTPQCGASGQCELAAVAAGMACGDDGDSQCDAADACDGVGYCLSNVAATGLTACSECPAGLGACQTCQQGACNDCVTLPATNDFGNDDLATIGWTVEALDGQEADWRIYFEAPPNRNAGSLPIGLSFAPSFGTDGNRIAPYDVAVDPFNQESENSRVTTSADVVPASITFDSWHVDEGTIDTKLIELSVDDGATWNVLVDCSAGAAFPFCVAVNDRLGSAWDAIAIDTAAFAGLTGRLRFTYNTQDTCCDFERGWFIDNLAFAQYCLDPQFP